jgi:hypothetical protein
MPRLVKLDDSILPPPAGVVVYSSLGEEGYADP